MPRIQDVAVALLEGSVDQLLTAVKETAVDKRDWAPSETTRSALDVLVECAGIQRMVAAMLRGEAPATEGGPSKEQYPTFEAAQALALETQAELTAAIRAVPDARLEEQVTMPWGAVMSVAEFLFLTSGHNMYHAGQVCYIQCLLGDTQMH